MLALTSPYCLYEQHKCLLNMGTADLYGSNDPFQVVSKLLLFKIVYFQ